MGEDGVFRMEVNMKCKICGSESSLFDTATVLRKYEVKYFKCSKCGFIQTEDPYWLSEAYTSAITSTDIGLVWRNIDNSKFLDILFFLCRFSKKSFLDYGGGYGMLVRMMRDKGYDFEWYDEYCDNLFAQTHEMRKEHYDVITSFEMLEHLPKPLENLDRLFKMGDTLIFSTNLVPDSINGVKDWWYFGNDHGQHISFYTPEAMREIARKYEKKYYRVFNMHIFSNYISWLQFMIIKVFGGAIFLKSYLRRRYKSLLLSDYDTIKKVDS